MPTTPINAIPYQGSGEAPNGPLLGQNLATQIDSRLNARFSTVAARNAAITSPVDGMECIVGTSKQIYYGASWHGVLPTHYSESAASGTTYTATADVISITVADPGYPYKIGCAGSVLLLVVGAGVVVFPQMRVNGVILNPQGANVEAGGSDVVNRQAIAPYGTSTTRSGGCVVTLTIVKGSGPAGSGFQAQASGVYNMLSATVFPV